MATVEFTFQSEHSAHDQLQSLEKALSSGLLRRNVQWFIQLRWVALGALVMVQILSTVFGGLLHELGVGIQGSWPAVLAIALFFANGMWWILHSRDLLGPGVNLWIQIAVDLLCLTIMVHFVGTVFTPAPFLYILHISLACIFFTIRQSFLVTLLSATLYSLCHASQFAGLLERRSIFLSLESVPNRPAADLLFGLSTVALYVIMWYVVSRLAKIIRVRDNQLFRARTLMREGLKERNKQFVQVTHQLKAPLDAIRTNVSLLRGGYCGEMSPTVRAIVDKIDSRATAMTLLIMDTLHLEHLKSGKYAECRPKAVDLGLVMRKCIDELQSLASKRSVTVESTTHAAAAYCDPEQTSMLLTNVLANAITYSHEHGIVSVVCGTDSDSLPFVEITDRGIGIPEDKLSLIFEEHFRTEDAIRHNSASTGIGLAIVKRVAQCNRARIVVTSDPGSRTVFRIVFRPAAQNQVAPDPLTTINKEQSQWVQ